MNEKKYLGLAGAVASLLVLSAGGAQAGTYRCLALKDSAASPGESVAAPAALNNRQQAVGFGSAPHDNGSRPGSVMWGQDRQAVHLEDSNSFYSNALDINDAGQAVGFISDLISGDMRAVTWTADGQRIDLRPLSPGGNGAASAINKRGKIVGQSEKKLASGDRVDRATLWSDGKAMDLGALHKGGSSVANDINDDGVIVGVSSTAEGETVPVRWVGGEISVLDHRAGSSAMPAAVSPSGIAVGWGFYGDGLLPHAYAWQGDTAIEMSSIAGYPGSRPRR
jgi:probable HAF family extracellular repeat protein